MQLHRAVSILFSLALLGSLLACGGGGGESPNASDPRVPAVDTIQTDPMVASEPGASAPSDAAQVPLYRIYERNITNTGTYANKFTDVRLNVQYTAPSGRQVSFIGFHDGDGQGGQRGDVWKIRFMPDELGTWNYAYTWSDGSAGGSGSFRAISAGAGRGVLRAYRDNPRWFAYNGTDPVFLKSYYVGAGGLTGVPIDWTAQNIYSKLVSRGYNHVQLNMLPIGWTGQKPADAPADHISKPLWRETPRVQNLDVWKRLEQHVHWLNERNVGINFFMGLDPKPSGSPDQYFALERFTSMSAADQSFYISYIAARLAPYANIAGWNYTWETDGFSGEDRLMELFAQHDPWNHLGTYHDEAPATNNFDNAKFGFAGIENHEYFGNSGGNPARDSASHYQSTIDSYRNKPVYMVEGNGLWRACWAREDAEQSITRAAWAVTLAGGSFTWQDTPDCDFGDPASDIFTWPASNPMVNRVGALYQVMTQDTAFHRMTPHNELLGDCWATFDRNGTVPSSPCFALAEPGKQYVVYKENGGTFSLSIAAGSYTATWIDTRAGTRQPANGGTVDGAASVKFTAPSTSSDWVLLLIAG